MSKIDTSKVSYTLQIEAKGQDRKSKQLMTFDFTNFFDTYGYLHRSQVKTKIIDEMFNQL